MSPYRSTITLARRLRPAPIRPAAAAVVHGEPGLLLALQAVAATTPGRAR